METTDKVGTLKELLDKMAKQREGQALYEAFIDALVIIADRDVQSDCALNAVKFMATQNAGARAKDPLDEAEVSALFEEECKRFSDDLLKMPGKFREWLKKGGSSQPKKPRVSIVDIIFGEGGITCNCETCQAFAKLSADIRDASEAPTEPPPPPGDIH